MRKQYKNQKDIPSHMIPYGLSPTQMTILHTVINNWNSQADNHNQWDNLGGDERLELVNSAMEDQMIEEIDQDADQLID